MCLARYLSLYASMLAVEDAHLMLVVARATDGRCRHGLLDPGNLGPAPAETQRGLLNQDDEAEAMVSS